MVQQFRCNVIDGSNVARRVANILIVLTAVYIGACTERVSVSVETFPLPNPVVEKLHLTVGVHYTEDFRSYRRTIDRDVWIYDLSLGSGSVDLFDQVLRSIFVSVISVSKVQFPSDHQPSPMLILEPSLYANVEGGRGVLAGYPKYTLNYGLKFYDANGTKLGSWTVSGHVSDIQTAMRHAAAKLLLGLPEQEYVHAALVRTEGRVDVENTAGQDDSR